MNDSVCEFAQTLLKRAKAREQGILKGLGGPGEEAILEEAEEATATETTVPIPTPLPLKSSLKQMESKGGVGAAALPVPVRENKENVEKVVEQEESIDDLEEDADDSNDNVDVSQQMEEDEEDGSEEDDEPLSALPPKIPISGRALQLQGKGNHDSASPVSRKSRLSALAQSINAWEDDLGTPSNKKGDTNASTPTAGASASTAGVKKAPRFSVSTPPSTNRLANPQNTSCHQFISANMKSKSMSPSRATIQNSSPAKLQTPTRDVLSPQRRTSPRKSVAFDLEQKDVTTSATASPYKSPVKELRKSPEKSVEPTAKRGPTSLEKSLELQGFVKVSSNTPNPNANASFLNKKRMFEKDDSSSCTTSSIPPAPKISKTFTTPAPVKFPEVIKTTPIKPPQSQPQQYNYNSRKSLQPDPSELTVAQKAKLFERQQQEQEQLKLKEQEANRQLRQHVGRLQQQSKANSAMSTPQPQDIGNGGKPTSTYLFGENPEELKSSKNYPSSPKKNVEEDEEKKSPSFLIAKSVKKIKVLKKDDKMYPSLTDIENTDETEADSDDNDNETNTSSVEENSPSLNSSMSTSSLGSFIQQKAHTNVNASVMSEMNTTAACRQIDALIDEALEGEMIEDDTFMMEGSVPLSTSSPIVRPSGTAAPLLHTVSIYRKNQQQLKKSAEESEGTFKVPSLLNTLDEETEEESIEALHDRIQILEQQVLIQQKGIAQASKALNVCESSFEFNNSTENVEGERVLLISTQKRSQLLSFISKLRSGRKDDHDVLSPSKAKFKPSSSVHGTMKIDKIQLFPNKSARMHQDYVYHFIVLIKHNESVYATVTVKTSPNSTTIDFPNEFAITELEPGFRVQVEVYALRTFKQIDVIPHNMKYHIKNPTMSNSSSTPSKTSTLSSFLTPNRSSKHTPKATDLKSTPSSSKASGLANPNSVRTSNFTLQGILHLNLSNLNKSEWEMSLINSTLILPNISMSIKCTNKNELNYKGFLTVFSDVSGLGAWHRRWAMLDQDYKMLFWTYPEDEGQKPPVLTVSLSSCITPRVLPASREVCARPNTFIIVTTREPLPTDQESLVVSVHEKYTAIKHLFSADNRMDRDGWIAVINKALTNMRAWGIDESSTLM